MTDLISRADAIAYIDRVINSGLGRNKSLDYIHKYISLLPSADAVSRGECDECKTDKEGVLLQQLAELQGDYETMKNAYEDALADAEWIPCNTQMPDELEAVNVTWVNHLAPPYYKHIEGVPFVDSAVYYRGKWYWWDATVIDVLAEYGEDCNAEQIDKDIEVVAWMPLPTPYKGGDSE